MEQHKAMSKVRDLDFTDNIAILFESLKILVAALDALCNYLMPLGLQVSWMKTKIKDF